LGDLSPESLAQILAVCNTVVEPDGPSYLPPIRVAPIREEQMPTADCARQFRHGSATPDTTRKLMSGLATSTLKVTPAGVTAGGKFALLALSASNVGLSITNEGVQLKVVWAAGSPRSSWPLRCTRDVPSHWQLCLASGQPAA
jgi:hypothetical protein